jgi:hypothetical protein
MWKSSIHGLTDAEAISPRKAFSRFKSHRAENMICTYTRYTSIPHVSHIFLPAGGLLASYVLGIISHFPRHLGDHSANQQAIVPKKKKTVPELWAC